MRDQDGLRRPFIGAISVCGSLRLAAQDVALSRRKQGFESPRERQSLFVHFDFSSFFGFLPKLARVVWATLFFLCFSSRTIAPVASRD